MGVEGKILLVTGGSGLVGSCLKDELKYKRSSNQFVFLSSNDIDLTDENAVEDLFSKYRPASVIHLAAKVGGLFANLADKDNSFFEQNMKINTNVLTKSCEYNVNRCLSCLSTCIFPDRIDYPLNESKIHSGPPHESNKGYALAKREVDIMNKEYNKKSIRSTYPDKTEECKRSRLFFSIIPTNVYGPFDNFDLKQAHLVPSLIRRAYEAILEFEESSTVSTDPPVVYLKVFGSGIARRQFIYGPDLAKLILKLMEEFEDFAEPSIILCPDEVDEISVAQLAQLICKIFSEKFPIKMETNFDGNKSDGQLRKTASNLKLRKLIPNFKFTPIEIGLRQTIDWFCSNYSSNKQNIRLGH